MPGVGLTVTIVPPNFKPAAEIRKDLRASLRIFDRYYRGRVQQRFAAQGPGWPPRKKDDEAASERREQQASKLAAHRLERNLFRQLKRAKVRMAKGKGSAQTVQRRELVVQHFYKMLRGEQGPLLKSDSRTQSSIGKLRERFERHEKQASGRLLGRLPAAMRSKIQGLVLTVRNLVPFSEVLNSGGAVGHGAYVPPRPFNYFEDLDVEVFAEIVANMILFAGR